LVGSQAEAFFWARPGQQPRLRIGATVLREADSQQLNPELGFSVQDSLIIAEAGDGVAARSGAERLEAYDPEAPFVQYTLVRTDHAPDGTEIPVFEPIRTVPADTAAIYRVRFTRVGAG